MENTLILGKNLNIKCKYFKKLLTYLLFSAQILSIILIIVFLGSIMLKADKANAAFGLDSNIKQVKTADSPKVYYLDHARKMKKAYTSETSYLAYGNKWSDIKIISKAELDKWPEINLVKTAADKNVYYINNGRKAEVKSEKDFVNFGFNWKNIAVIRQRDLNTYRLVSYEQIGLVYTISDNSEQKMLISTDSLSPANAYIAVNTNDNLLAVFNFKSLGKTTEIKSLTFNLIGVFKSEVIKNIYLADENGIDYGYNESIDGRIVSFNLDRDPLIISSGEEKKVKVFVDLASCQDCVNHSMGVGILKPSDVKTDAQLINNFPVAGGTLKLVNAGSLLGQLKVEEKSINTTSNRAVIGTTGQILGKFKISEISNKEDVIIKEILFVNVGSAVNSTLVNFKLKNDRNSTVSQVSAMSVDNIINFKISDYKISKGESETWTVFADISGGENQTINLNVNQVKVVSKEYGFSLPSTILNIDESIIIIRELLGVTSKNLAANKTVFAKQTGVIISNFQIRNNNRKITLKGLEISLVKSAFAPDFDKAIFAVDYNTGDVYGSDSGSNLTAGATVYINLNNINLEPKKDITLALVTDIPSGTKNGDKYQIKLNKVGYFSENNMYYTDSVNIVGANLTVNRSNLYIYANKDIENIGYTKGQKGIKIASFILEAAAGDDVVIDSITLARGSQTSGLVTYDNGFSNMKVYIGGTGAKSNISQPYGPTYNFEGFNYRLGANNRIEVKVYVDTENDLNASEAQLALVDLVAAGYNSGIPTTVYNTNINSYGVAFGQVKIDLSALAGGSVNIGEKNNLIASFKIRNSGDELIKLNYLTITTSDEGLSNSLGYSNLKIVDKITGKSISSISRPVAGANRNSLGGFNIEAGKEAVFDVRVDANQDVPSSSFSIYFSELDAEGRTSGIDASVEGDPTLGVQVVVN